MEVTLLLENPGFSGFPGLAPLFMRPLFLFLFFWFFSGFSRLVPFRRTLVFLFQKTYFFDYPAFLSVFELFLASGGHHIYVQKYIQILYF